MDAWVYHSARRNAETADFVRRLEGSGEYSRVISANSRYYRGEIHRGAVVYHDGSRRDLVWANEREGVDVRQFAGSEMQSETGPRADAPQGKGAGQAVAEEVKRRGPWYTAYRDGEKVGKAQRSEDDAWALLGSGQ